MASEVTPSSSAMGLGSREELIRL